MPRFRSIPTGRDPALGPLCLAAAGAAALSRAPQPDWLALGLVLMAGILIAAAGLRWGRAAMSRADRQVRLGTALACLQGDHRRAVLTDGSGRVLGLSAAARAAHGSPATLAALLRPRLADAEEAVARRLELGAGADLGQDKGERDKVPIPQQLGDDLFLWCLDGPDRMGAPSIPGVVATSSGSIIAANEAFLWLAGDPPDHLDGLALDPPLVPGRVQPVDLGSGPEPRLVAEAVVDDRRAVFLFEHGTATPQSGRWDAVEDLPVPLLKLARSGEIVAANRNARSLLPMPIEPGARLSDLLEGSGRPLVEWIADVADRRPVGGPQVLRGTGAHHDTVLRVSLSPAGSLAEPHLIAVLDDVSEFKALEAQFVQSQKMQALGQLAGGVAHDFNNLLTAISGHCDLLLLRRDGGDPDYADLIQIRQNVNRAASLVGQLLAFSRKQSMMPETLDLRDALSDLTHLLNRLVGEKVRLTLDHDPGLRHVRADKRQLEQVIMNLVVNARDAMPEGGDIRIETGNCHLEAPRTLDRAVLPPGHYVLVKVADQGVGIPADRLPKIFEPFYTTKKPGEGTGLGLSTAYGIVKQTGGYIFAESEVGRGTTFTLWFPAHDRPKARARAVMPRRPAPPPPPGGVILLAEDEAPVRAVAARALRLRGYQVIECDCAEAALAILAEEGRHVDLILTDVVLPDMDGPTWVRKGLELRPGLKVIFASGYAEEVFSEQKATVPGSAFLPKPYSLADLTAMVAEQMEPAPMMPSREPQDGPQARSKPRVEASLAEGAAT